MLITDSLTERIIGCGIEVHRCLGPGLFEATYEEAFCIELRAIGLPFIRQVGIPVSYKGYLIGEYRPDLVIDGQVVVEIKSVERLTGVHEAQVLAYLRILKLRVGLLINFNTEVVRHGLRRVIL